MIHGKLTCPQCGTHMELTATKAPAQQSSNGVAKPSSEGTGDVGELLSMINDDVLDGKAADFVAQTRDRYKQYKDRIRMSEKQMSWLRTIAAGDSEDSW